MRKLFYIIAIAASLIGCSGGKQNKSLSSPANTKLSLEELDQKLDSLNEEGEYCLVRGSDREYDTIIDHIRYIYVKDAGYDTPKSDDVQ